MGPCFRPSWCSVLPFTLGPLTGPNGHSLVEFPMGLWRGGHEAETKSVGAVGRCAEQEGEVRETGDACAGPHVLMLMGLGNLRLL